MTQPVLLFPREGTKADEALAQFILATSDELRLAVYGLNRPVIVQAILSQHTAGVPLRLITDHLQSFGHSQADALKQLFEAGVPIKVNAHEGLMHIKMAVRGLTAVALGSFNWTNNAETVNDEVLEIIEDVALAAHAAAMFDCMWSDASRFRDWHPPTPAELANARLMLMRAPEV